MEHKQTSEGDVLPNHHTELNEFALTELIPQFSHECWVYSLVVGRELLRVADRERLTGLEFALTLGQMDLRDDLFIESLTRRRRVACEASGIAVVQRRDLEPRQLLDARWDDTLLMTRAEECEVALEEVRQDIEGICVPRTCRVRKFRGIAHIASRYSIGEDS